jgi:hypothetical protein
MTDEQSDRIVKALEEIRDLLKERNTLLAQMSAETAQRRRDLGPRVLAQRRRFLWILAPLLLLALGFILYLAFWVIPRSDQRQTEQQMEEYRMIQSNYLSQPNP